MLRAFTTLLAILIVTPALASDQQKTPRTLGKKVENFTLKDFRGKSHSLADYKGKVVVLAFLGTECPLAKMYAPRLVAMQDKYEKRGVQFLGINANTQDSITELAAYARRHKIDFPLLKDLGNKVADSVEALRTPEVFLLDKDGVIRYWGRIDDQYGIGGVFRERVDRRDLQIALDEILAGKKVSKPIRHSVGCYIGRVVTPKKNAKVTYSNQIARIFQNRCVECHREKEIAPFALTDYEEVKGWGETILEVVEDNRMPPWHASPKYGHFANDRRLTTDEKKLIAEWVKAGSPQGDPKQLPKPKTYVNGWQLPRKPDLVIPMRSRAYPVPAEGEVKYKYFTVDPKFKEDKWIKASQILPGNRAVVHHILVFALGRGQRRVGVGGFLAAYVPGQLARPYPKGMAKRIPAGSRLVFQVHYTPIGSATEDLSKLGLVFADEKDVKEEVVTTQAASRRLRIPPNDGNYRVTARSITARSDLKILGFMPHMHLRGKAFKYEIVHAAGKRETILDVPKYDFNWQTAYRLKEPLMIKRGSYLFCTAHFDNSEENPFNPNPNATVRWGDQTWDEMMIGYFDIALPRTKQPAQPNGAGLGRNRPQNNREPAALRIFKLLDKNGDGKLTKAEAPERMERLFRLLDRNKDGVLTPDEVKRR